MAGMAGSEAAGPVGLLTIDVEDWRQSTLDGTMPVSPWAADYALDLLDLVEGLGLRATCFVQGMIAEAFPGLVREITGRGHEGASHGFSHTVLGRLTRSSFESELSLTEQAFAADGAPRPLGFRAPDFSVGPDTWWALEVLEERGYLYDSSVFPIRSRRYGVPGFSRRPGPLPGRKILEFPLSTLRLAGVNVPVLGGGYLRLPPVALSLLAARLLRREGIAPLVYLHPYELHPEELSGRVRGVPRRLRFTKNFGRSRARERIRRLLGEAGPFAPIGEFIEGGRG